MNVCPPNCTNYLTAMLQKLDQNIYSKDPTSFNYALLQAINNELCQSYGEVTKAKNDIYLWVTVTSEMVIRGSVPNGLDMLKNRAVVDIIAIGDTLDSNGNVIQSYIENVDYTVTECGVLWAIPNQVQGYYYGYGYGYGGYPNQNGYGYYPYYNPYYPLGRKEPTTPNGIYYVTYRYGVRNENLYNDFGALVKLMKPDRWTYPQYRNAIKSLIIAFLGGPNDENLKDALSIFHPRAYIEIVYVSTQTGWVLDVSTLYTAAEYLQIIVPKPYPLPATTVDTQTTGCIIKSTGANEVVFKFHHSELLDATTQSLIRQLISVMKPAGIIANIQFLIGA